MAYGYKLVRYDKWGHPHSAYTLGRVIRYHLRKPTFPHKGDGPLAVFKSYIKLMRYVRSTTSNRKVFRCRYKVTRGKRGLWCGSVCRYGAFPVGTDFADSVTLLYEVK